MYYEVCQPNKNIKLKIITIFGTYFADEILRIRSQLQRIIFS